MADKRELEILVEKVNCQQASVNYAHFGAHGESTMLQQILQEKDSYIAKLEKEMGGMRQEIEE